MTVKTFDNKDKLIEHIKANRDYKETMLVLDCTSRLIDELLHDGAWPFRAPIKNADKASKYYMYHGVKLHDIGNSEVT